MTRAIALFIAISMLAGCRGNSPLPAAVDPFVRTRVEPPPTGSIGNQPPGSPYYANPQQGATPPAGAAGAAPAGVQGGMPAGVQGTAPASVQGTTPATPAGGQGYQPPDGSFQFQGKSDEDQKPLAQSQSGDRISIPVDARDLSKRPSALAAGPKPDSWPSSSLSAKVATATGSPSRSSGVELTGGSNAPERFVRTIEARPDKSTSQAPTAAGDGGRETEPANLPSSQGVINIMDLPAAGAANRPRTRTGGDGIVLASATQVIDDSPGAAASAPLDSGVGDSFSQRTRYGHDPDYGWVRGQLEYSQIDRRWKVRYIPIDGEMDDFGGSVLVANPDGLSGCERGDYVEIHGRLDTSDVDERHFTPEFQIAEIRRLSE